MIVFSLLALGLSGRAVSPDRTGADLVCAVASAGHELRRRRTSPSPRSVAAYVVAPLVLALVVDRVVAVIRRHVLGDDERSAWTALGRCACRAASGSPGLVLLYSLRFTLAARRRRRRGCAGWCSTRLRCPRCPARRSLRRSTRPPTKKAALLALYRAHPDYGNRAVASQGGRRAGPGGRPAAAPPGLVPVRRARRQGVMIPVARRHRPGPGRRTDRPLHGVLRDRIRRMQLADPAPPAARPRVRLARPSW